MLLLLLQLQSLALSLFFADDGDGHSLSCVLTTLLLLICSEDDHLPNVVQCRCTIGCCCCCCRVVLVVEVEEVMCCENHCDGKCTPLTYIDSLLPLSSWILLSFLSANLFHALLCPKCRLQSLSLSVCPCECLSMFVSVCCAGLLLLLQRLLLVQL